MHTIGTMAALYNCSSESSIAVTDKVESRLLRLPLELRQQIYGIIFGPGRLVDLRIVRVGLRAWSKSMIHRTKSEKQPESDAWSSTMNDRIERLRLYESYKLENDDDIDSDSEEKQSESDMKDAYRVNEDFRFEWRTGILEVSRAISNEALDILYGQNTFVVDIHARGYRKFHEFGVANLRRIHHLRVVARPMGVSYGTPLVFDPQLWLPLLEGLQQFCIVAEQPSAARGYYNAPSLEQKLCEWTTWLDPILEYFSVNLPKTTVVSLDADGRAETTAMMDKHFDSGYQKVTTVTGDSCFQRGQYSLQSGYGDNDDLISCFFFPDGCISDAWSD